MNRYLLILPVIALAIVSWTNPAGPEKSAAVAKSAQKPIDTLKLNDLIFSDFMSPNGDGLNDRFVIVNVMYYPGNSLQIFNRWGETVYYAEPYLNEWEGTNNRGNASVNERLTDGVYYFEFYDGIGNNVTGKITLKR